jgi:hypothetical protein
MIRVLFESYSGDDKKPIFKTHTFKEYFQPIVL